MQDVAQMFRQALEMAYKEREMLAGEDNLDGLDELAREREKLMSGALAQLPEQGPTPQQAQLLRELHDLQQELTTAVSSLRLETDKELKRQRQEGRRLEGYRRGITGQDRKPKCSRIRIRG